MAEGDLRKILIIENSKQITGAFRSTSTYCQYLAPQFRFHLAVPRGCWTEHFSENFKIHSFRYLELQRSWQVLGYLPVLLYNAIKCHRIIRRNAIGVVHVGDLYNMLGVLLKFLNPRIRLIYHIRLRKGSYLNALYQVYLGIIKRYADHILCVSQMVAGEVGESSKVQVLYDALPLHWLQKESMEPPSLKINLLYVANYVPGKGHHYALEVMKRLQKRGHDLKLKFVGGDLGKTSNKAYLNHLKRQCKSWGLDHLVVFSGPVQDMIREMRQAHIILNFSESESFSMVCLEALACRKPVISTRSGGPSEIIRHGVNGLLVERGDVKQMAQAVIQLVKDPSMRKKFSSKAQLDFEEKFNLPLLAQKLATIYRKKCETEESVPGLRY